MATRKFEVGDKLRIREWEDMKSEFGMKNGGVDINCAFTFTEEMKRFCGKNFTVSSIYGDRYHSEERLEMEHGWTYNISADMLEYREIKEFNSANDNEIRMLFA